jgi:hypothetical protein
MSDLRTDLEKEIHETIQVVLDYFTQGKIWKLQFREIMGKLRDVNVHLENKRLGCISGKHLAQCLCDHGVNLTVFGIKNRAKRLSPSLPPGRCGDGGFICTHEKHQSLSQLVQKPEQALTIINAGGQHLRRSPIRRRKSAK